MVKSSVKIRMSPSDQQQCQNHPTIYSLTRIIACCTYCYSSWHTYILIAYLPMPVISKSYLEAQSLRLPSSCLRCVCPSIIENYSSLCARCTVSEQAKINIWYTRRGGKNVLAVEKIFIWRMVINDDMWGQVGNHQNIQVFNILTQ